MSSNRLPATGKTAGMFVLCAFLSLTFLAVSGGVSHAAYHGMIRDGWADRIKQGVFAVADARYDDGLKIFGEYIEKFPNDPAGHFFYAAGLKEKMQRNDDLEKVDEFFRFAERCKKISAKILSKNPDDIVTHIYMGGILGYISLMEVKRKNLLTALLRGIDAKKHLELAMEARPDIPDSYFGLGMLYYFASMKSQRVGGIKGWVISKFITHGEDLRAKGIEYTRHAMESHAISEDFARGTLMWMALYMDDYETVTRWGEYNVAHFLNDTSSRWALGRVAIARDDCQSARKWFEQINAINDKTGLELSNFPDVAMALKMTSMCEHAQKKEWKKVRALKREVLRWLGHKPKIVIEYQEEDDLIESWRRKATALGKKKFSASLN